MKMYWVKLALLLAVVVGGAKFYHYNYVANTFGQARMLKLPGLREFVCQGLSYKPAGPDHCGKRSIYGDGDWGITAYIVIFGVETVEEARAIANFMVEARRRAGHTRIPMDLEVFKHPRSQTNNYCNTRIFHQRFEAE